MTTSKPAWGCPAEGLGTADGFTWRSVAIRYSRSPDFTTSVRLPEPTGCDPLRWGACTCNEDMRRMRAILAAVGAAKREAAARGAR